MPRPRVHICMIMVPFNDFSLEDSVHSAYPERGLIPSCRVKSDRCYHFIHSGLQGSFPTPTNLALVPEMLQSSSNATDRQASLSPLRVFCFPQQMM